MKFKESKGSATIRRKRNRSRSSFISTCSSKRTDHEEIDVKDLFSSVEEGFLGLVKNKEKLNPKAMLFIYRSKYFIKVIGFREIIITKFIGIPIIQLIIGIACAMPCPGCVTLFFRYGFLTWEWKEAIRSYLYPAIFTVWYKLLQIFQCDSRAALVKSPMMLQGLFMAVCDLHLYKFTSKHFGIRTAKLTLACHLISWFGFYTYCRTLSNSTEAGLTILALYFYSWSTDVRRSDYKFIVVMLLSVIVRPTAAIFWFPLCIWQVLVQKQQILKLISLYAIVGLPVLYLSTWLDKVFYGRWVFVPYNFLKVNVFANIAVFYGTHPFLWYLTSGLPVILGPHILLFIPSLWHCWFKGCSKIKLLVLVVLWNVFVYSCLSHKEFRFLLPILPLCMLFCGVFLNSLLSEPADLSSSASQDGASEGGDSVVEESNVDEKAAVAKSNGDEKQVMKQSPQNKTDDEKLRLEKKRQRMSWVTQILVGLAVTNVPIAVYTSLIHQRGAIDVTRLLHDSLISEKKSYAAAAARLNEDDVRVLFLMPCHSTPYYSHIHKNISLRFLTCEPNLSHTPNYTDEADRFFQNPYEFLKEAFKSKSTPLPTHLVMFDSLETEISKFVKFHKYIDCAHVFHSHFTEPRRGRYILVKCLSGPLRKKGKVAREPPKPKARVKKKRPPVVKSEVKSSKGFEEEILKGVREPKDDRPVNVVLPPKLDRIEF